MPVTTPVPGPTDTVFEVQLQVPPKVVSIKAIDWPTQTILLPVIGDVGLTIIVVNTLQPEPKVYEIITVPDAIPVNEPVTGLMVAIVVLALLHMPPGEPLLNVTDWPTHTAGAPVIVVGNGTTVTTVKAIHPPDV